MAENQGNDLEVRIGGDVSGFETAANSAAKTLDNFAKKAADAGAAIDKNGDAIARATQKTVDNLSRKYDPVFAAQERYKKSIAEIAALEKLTGPSESTERAYQNAFAQRTAAINRVIAANSTLNASNAQIGTGIRGVGNQFQNASFQVGDFFTQVASGGGIIRPLIQQGTQLVSAFGPWGAAIGAAGAALGAIVVSLGDAEDATDKLTTAQQKYNAALSAAAEITKTSAGSDVSKRKQQLDDATKGLQDQIKDQTQRLQDVQVAIERFQNLQKGGANDNGGLLGLPPENDVRTLLQLKNFNLADAKQQVQDLLDSLNKTNQALLDLGDTSQRRDLLQALTDAAVQQDKDREAALKRGNDLIDQDKKRVDGLQDYIKSLEDAAHAEEGTSQQKRIQQALIQAQKKLQDEYGNSTRQLTDLEKQRVVSAIQLKDQLEQQKKVLKDIADEAAQQDKDRAAAQKRGAEIIADDNKRNVSVEKYIKSLEDKNRLEKQGETDRAVETAQIEAQSKLTDEYGNSVRKLTDLEKQRIDQAVRGYEKQKALTQELQSFGERAFDRIGAAITQMTVEGKASALSFKDVWLGVVSELTQEFIKLATINPLKNAIFGTNSPTLTDAAGAFGSLGKLFGGSSAPASNADFFGSSVVPQIHSGGIVGSDSTRMRSVSNDMFSAAPRFHSGLMPDEFPAILQKGEGVFTQGQMQALGNRGTSIEIIDQRGAGAPPIEQQVMTDGRVRLLIKEASPAIVQASVAQMENRQRRGVRA